MNTTVGLSTLTHDEVGDHHFLIELEAQNTSCRVQGAAGNRLVVIGGEGARPA